jgi:glycosyltransferase involved in cell wall biosynthesis
MNLINPDRISVCICTFRRPDMLARLLDALAEQRVDSSFSFDIVVVDNDSERSAESTVRSFQLRRNIETLYDCEPVRNISMTRNRAIRNAAGNLIAFIDDDEAPVQGWLAELHRSRPARVSDRRPGLAQEGTFFQTPANPYRHPHLARGWSNRQSPYSEVDLR